MLAYTNDVPQLQLNLLELWACLIFQTLPVKERCEPPVAELHRHEGRLLWKQAKFQTLDFLLSPFNGGLFSLFGARIPRFKILAQLCPTRILLGCQLPLPCCSKRGKVGEDLPCTLCGGVEKQVIAHPKQSQIVNFGYVKFRIPKK